MALLATGSANAEVTPNSDPATTGAKEIAERPIDARIKISSGTLQKSGAGEWTSAETKSPFPFEELIYSWNLRLPENQGFRLYLQAGFSESDKTDWLYAGYWGAVKDLDPGTTRTVPKFDRGTVDMDWLRLKEKASSFRFKVVEASTAPLTVLPDFNVVVTDNHPSDDAVAKFADKVANDAIKKAAAGGLFDLPFRRQMSSTGVPMPNRCQSAALATAMQYLGTSVTLEQIVAKTWDPEYKYPGIWPRVIGAANDFGLDGYIDRFRDWDRVRAALGEGKVILCSIRLKKGQAKVPPYESMGNHIVALNGMTDDGRVVVTDSFLAKSGRGYRCQWLKEDFETIWMKNKNGVAMVISPPAGAKLPKFSELPAFPEDRKPITGDDH